MRSPLPAALALFALPALAALPAARAGEEKDQTVESRLAVESAPRVYRPSYVLRQEPTFAFDKGEGTLSLGALGSFKVWARDRQLVVDKNKDGKLGGDAVVAQEFPRPTAPVALHVGTADGREVFYHVSFTGYDARAKAMRYTAASALRGLIGGQQAFFIDEDGNGCYTDAGKDAVYMQGWPMAAPLGKLVFAGQRFYSIESVDEKALRLTVKPADVKAGSARVAAPAGVWVLAAVIEGGGNHFALGQRPIWVPEGDYRVAFALLANSAYTCTMLPTGKGMGLKVVAGKDNALAIRGVDRLAFSTGVANNGREVTVKPPELPLVGRAGETYTHWTNNLPPPRVIFSKRETTGNKTDWKVFRRVKMPLGRNGRAQDYTWEIAKDNVYEAAVRIEVEWPTTLAGTAKGETTVNIKRGKAQK